MPLPEETIATLSARTSALRRSCAVHALRSELKGLAMALLHNGCFSAVSVSVPRIGSLCWFGSETKESGFFVQTEEWGDIPLPEAPDNLLAEAVSCLPELLQHVVVAQERANATLGEAEHLVGDLLRAIPSPLGTCGPPITKDQMSEIIRRMAIENRT